MSDDVAADSARTERAAQPHGERHEWRWAIACLGIGFTTLALVPLGTHYEHPAAVEALGLAAVALALRRSALRPRGWPIRIVLGLSLLLALPAVGASFFGYYQAFHDFPWLVLTTVMLALIVGSWLGRQRWLAVCLCAGIVWFAIGARQPPSAARLPRTVRVSDVSMALWAMEPWPREGGKKTLRLGDRSYTVSWSSPGWPEVSCYFVLKTRRGVHLDRVYDRDHMRMEGRTVWGLLQVTCWTLRRWSVDEEYPANEMAVIAYTFPPSWSRRLDYVVTVPRWPTKPAASVTVPLPPAGGKLNRPPLTSRGHGITLAVSEVRWSRPQSTSPPEAAVRLTIDYNERPTTTRTHTRFRVSDAGGRRVSIHSHELSWNGDRATELWELSPLEADARTIRIDAFTPRQVERNLLVFRFLGLPNPRQARRVK